MERPSPDYDIAAVVALANNLGLGRIDPTVLKLAHHTTLRLSPLPIVARVQSSEPVDEAAAAMGRELALAQYLTDVGAPTVAPIADPPPGPHVLGRSATTLWSYVEHRPPRGGKDLIEAAEALRSIHEALLGFEGDLPPFTDNIDRCGSLLADLTAMPMIAPADRAFLERDFGHFGTGWRRSPSEPSRCTAIPTSAMSCSPRADQSGRTLRPLALDLWSGTWCSFPPTHGRYSETLTPSCSTTSIACAASRWRRGAGPTHHEARKCGTRRSITCVDCGIVRRRPPPGASLDLGPLPGTKPTGKFDPERKLALGQ